MKNYWKAGLGVLLVGVTVATTVACQKQATTPNISKGVIMDDLHTVTDSSETYDDLNHDSTVLDSVASAITNTTDVIVVPEWDFILENDQNPTATQVTGTSVMFTVKSISNTSESASGFELISGSFSFSDTLSSGDISYGVKVADQTLSYTSVTNESYYELSNNQTLVNSVRSAINSQKSINTTWKQDFILKNDQEPSDMIAQGDTCNFRVLTMGDKIKGAFGFKVKIE